MGFLERDRLGAIDWGRRARQLAKKSTAFGGELTFHA
jgi:hypothetical protein